MQSGVSDEAAPGGLVGRMLHVSRLATLGEMAAGVAHELNQPLTAIANYAQACDRLLEQPAVDLQDLRTALREITDQAVRAGQIIRRLRVLARSNDMHRATTDVNDMVNEVAALARADAGIHNVRLALQLADDLPPVAVDPVQIQHVILNLVRNALEALDADAAGNRVVTLSTSAAGDAVEVAVLDNGPGVAADVRDLIFDPFFSTREYGTGLGLPISNTIVRAHGGSLGYRANSPRGACFFIHIPCQPVT